MKNKLYRLRYFQSHQIERFSLSKCYFIQKSRGAKSMLTQNCNSILHVENHEFNEKKCDVQTKGKIPYQGYIFIY